MNIQKLDQKYQELLSNQLLYIYSHYCFHQGEIKKHAQSETKEFLLKYIVDDTEDICQYVHKMFEDFIKYAQSKMKKLTELVKKSETFLNNPQKYGNFEITQLLIDDKREIKVEAHPKSTILCIETYQDLIFTASSDSKINVWNKSLKLIQSINNAHTNWIRCLHVILRNNVLYIVSAGDDSKVSIYQQDVNKIFQPKSTIQDPNNKYSYIRSTAILGNLLICGRGKNHGYRLMVHHFETGELLYSIPSHNNTIVQIKVLPCNHLVTTDTTGKAFVFLLGQKKYKKISTGVLKKITSVCPLRNTSFLIGNDRGQIQLFNYKFRLLRHFKVGLNAVDQIQVLDSNLIACQCYPGQLKILNIKLNQIQYTIQPKVRIMTCFNLNLFYEYIVIGDYYGDLVVQNIQKNVKYF